MNTLNQEHPNFSAIIQKIKHELKKLVKGGFPPANPSSFCRSRQFEAKGGGKIERNGKKGFNSGKDLHHAIKGPGRSLIRLEFHLHYTY